MSKSTNKNKDTLNMNIALRIVEKKRVHKLLKKLLAFQEAREEPKQGKESYTITYGKKIEWHYQQKFKDSKN